jgi:hypothetical protein
VESSFCQACFGFHLAAAPALPISLNCSALRLRALAVPPFAPPSFPRIEAAWLLNWRSRSAMLGRVGMTDIAPARADVQADFGFPNVLDRLRRGRYSLRS